MRDDPAGKVLSLIEAGDYVINVRYLIMRRRVGKPDPRLELDIRLEEGIKVRLKGGDALTFDRGLSRLVPPDDPAPGDVGRPQVRARKGRPPRPADGH